MVIPCQKCFGKRTKYTGLIFHDLRRTAARNLRRAGISETVIMKIGGCLTRSVFERYAIVSRGDIVDAMRKLQINQQESQMSREIGHGTQPDQLYTAPKSVTKAVDSRFIWCPEGDLNPHDLFRVCGF